MSRFASRSKLRACAAALASGAAAAVAAASVFCGTAGAAPLDVGSGPNAAEVVFNFPDGFVADYNVHFSGAAADGFSLTSAADAADPNLALAWTDFGASGQFLTVASFTGGHVGDGSVFNESRPEDWWHEWYGTSPASDWTFGNGASTDTVTGGGRFGWVFGSAAAPVPEPAAAGGLLLAGAGGLLARSRRYRHRLQTGRLA
jgi:hypothetical protein